MFFSFKSFLFIKISNVKKTEANPQLHFLHTTKSIVLIWIQAALRNIKIDVFSKKTQNCIIYIKLKKKFRLRGFQRSPYNLDIIIRLSFIFFKDVYINKKNPLLLLKYFVK